MARLGSFALVLALVLAGYGAVAAAVGTARRRPILLESARTTAYSLLGVVAAANGAMLAAILADDFSIRYVALNSSRSTPTFFKVLALWSADEGSLLLWNLVLAGFLAAVAFRFRHRRPETFGWALAVLYAIAAFYLVLVAGPTRPFATLSQVPLDGRGPLPLLQNHPLMAAHPPMLYLGFVGFAVPFAFAMAALVTGTTSDAWIAMTRRWTLAAWGFLTAGLVLGALWSYGVLGWGGYWAWDPVENVALLPWLTATAFLHSAIVQERRGMLRVWNLSLVVATFALTTFGTFLTRGSILASVHTFAQSLVGPLYLGFLLLVVVSGFGLLAARSWRLRRPAELDAPLSREGAFLGNNVVLVVLAAVVLVGTIHPLAVEALTRRQVTVGGPFFEQTTVPLFLLLLFLMGVGPLLPWRAATPGRLGRRLAWPSVLGAATILVLAAAGARNLGAVLALGLAVFVAAANLGQMIVGVRGFSRATGARGVAAARGAVARNRRLHGGLLAHLGVAIAAVAITTSSSFAAQSDVTLARGQDAGVGAYRLRYTGARSIEEPHRRVVVAILEVRRGDRALGVVSPSLNLYPGANEPIGTPSVRYGAVEDLYASVVAVEDEGRRASFRLYVNPGVTWLWVGGAVVVLGAVVAGWPERARRPRSTRPAPTPVVREEDRVAT